MGAVCPPLPSGDTATEGSGKEPAAQEPEADPGPSLVPITLNLYEPPVDVEAPLCDRDIELVQITWARMAQLGHETVGKVIFMHIFRIAPEAQALFPFRDYGSVDLFTKELAIKHYTNVASTIGTAVSLLRELDTLVPVLQSLGLRHVSYGVLPAHYDVVGQAVVAMLTDGLGKIFTKCVANAWTKVYMIVKQTMIGDFYKDAEEEAARAAEEEAARVSAQEAEAAAKKSSDADAKKKAASRKKPAEASKKSGDAVAKKKNDAPPAAEQPAETPAEKPAEKPERPSQEALREREAAWKELSQSDRDGKLAKFFEVAKQGNRQSVDRLLTEEAVFINATDKDGWTGLMKAADAGKSDMCQHLLSQGADVSMTVKLGEWGNSALHLAARAGHVEVMRVLVKYAKAKDVNAKNFQKKSVRDLAQDDDQMLRIIRKVS